MGEALWQDAETAALRGGTCDSARPIPGPAGGSLCDRCCQPGRCCSGFLLNSGEFGRGLTWLELAAKVARALVKSVNGGPMLLPFVPLVRRRDDLWLFWCPLLGRDGRCTVYDDRPQLCADYQAGQDMLCAMWTPPAAVEQENGA